MQQDDRGGYWSEHFGTIQDVVCEVILTTEPGTFVEIVEGDLESPNATFNLIVPPWGEA